MSKSDYWEKEEEKRVKRWWKSKERLFIVTINWGGGLSEEVIEVRREEYDDEPDFWSLDGNFGYTTDETRDGYAVVGFKKHKDAKLFLEGAKFFKSFISQFFFEKDNKQTIGKNV